MLFVTIGKAKPEYTYEERLARRMEFIYPEEKKVVAEYWLPTNDPAVIVVAEADTVETIFQSIRVWDRYFDFTVLPAVTAEEGLKMAQRMMQATTA